MSKQAEAHEGAATPLPDWVQHVLRQVQRLDYGVVQITVHQGAVSQVDITERRRFAGSTRKPDTRFSPLPTAEGGGGI